MSPSVVPPACAAVASAAFTHHMQVRWLAETTTLTPCATHLCTWSRSTHELWFWPQNKIEPPEEVRKNALKPHHPIATAASCVAREVLVHVRTCYLLASSKSLAWARCPAVEVVCTHGANPVAVVEQMRCTLFMRTLLGVKPHVQHKQVAAC